MTHQDIGQLQMYVNYYDRYEKNEDENPTIGILLTPNKNHTVVELSLPKESNVYATEYQLYLPKKEVLENNVEKWVEEFEESKKVLKDEI
ncbi:MAG: PDDEXK nuclease domain-containing protein, partial [Campylobacterota bacterium]|nr:PDDEXK nuclease domain-containing protein [Campylobacterota bacterium]